MIFKNLTKIHKKNSNWTLIQNYKKKLNTLNEVVLDDTSRKSTDKINHVIKG